jgi:hypothetical protein
MQQAWTRLARPYLEFMYLNNAYHFYAPDPGPATYLWFRVYYDTGKKDHTGEKDDAGNEIVYPVLDAVWIKIPDMDELGRPRYHVSLEYQRYLSVTEHATQSEITGSLYYRGPDGRKMPVDHFYSRIINSPDAGVYKDIVGRPRPRFILQVPFHPYLMTEQQYVKPAPLARDLVASYVRHMAKRPHPEHPEWPVHCVRAYRVTHMIPAPSVFAAGHDPLDPETYRPYYYGFFDAEGRLVDPDEPLLYWLLPILREDSNRPSSRIRDYARVHAGDPDWIYDPATKKWGPEPKEVQR